MKNDAKFEEELTCRFKIDMGNWWILTWTLESLKNSHFNVLHLSKYTLLQLKDRRAIFHDTEERYKIWREIDLSFQNWQEEFDKFWPEHSKVSKIFTLLTASFWTMYILFELKSTEELSFMTLESDEKFEENLTCGLENNVGNLTNFHQITWKR